MAYQGLPLALAAAQDPAQYVNPYQALIEQKRAQLAQPMAPMYTPEQIEQRRADNTRQYQLGLLGQLSGDEALGNVGGQVLKQALAARAPKISERGTSDGITGEFTYDPGFLRQQEEGKLDRLEGAYAADQARVEAARLAAEAKKEQAERDAVNRRELRVLMGNNKQGREDDRKAESRYKLEDSMADDFRKESNKPELVKAAFHGLKATAERADAASDIAFVYQYMRMLDPTSVVREGEFATAQNAAGVPDRIRNMYNQAMTGQRLNPAQRKEFLGTAERLNQNADREIGMIAKRYHGNARKRGLDLSAVTPGYGPEDYADDPRGGGGGGAPTVVDVGAMFQRPANRTPMGAPRQALPLANPPKANRLVVEQ